MRAILFGPRFGADAISILALAVEHDYRYVVVTSIVVGLLILAFALGAVER